SVETEASPTRPPGPRPHLPDHHALSQGLARAQPGAVAARAVELTLERIQTPRPVLRAERRGEAGAETGRPGASCGAFHRRRLLWGEAPARSRHGAGAKPQAPHARRAVRGPVEGSARPDAGPYRGRARGGPRGDGRAR